MLLVAGELLGGVCAVASAKRADDKSKKRMVTVWQNTCTGGKMYQMQQASEWEESEAVDCSYPGPSEILYMSITKEL